MRRALQTLTAVMALAITPALHAGIVTFAPLTSSSSGPVGDGTTYSEAGLTFTSSFQNYQALYHWGTSEPANADPNGATLFQNYPGDLLTVTRTGGGAFFLNSFDLADVYNLGASAVIPFSYVDGSGSHNSNLLLDNLVGLQTFNFGFSLTSFSLTQNPYPYFQLDNVRFDETSVPEPTTLALLGLGIAAIGYQRRKRAA